MTGILTQMSKFDAFSALCAFNDVQFFYMAYQIYKYGDKLTSYFAFAGVFFDFCFHLGLESNGLIGNLSAFPFIFISIFPYRFIYKDKLALTWYTAFTAFAWWLGSFTGAPTDPMNHPVRGDKGFILAHGGNHIITSITYTMYIWWLMKNKHNFAEIKK